jgi:hypothetical protein
VNGLSLSVMDYLPLNIVSSRDGFTQGVTDYFSPVIGAYDLMAIKYAYSEVPGEADGVPHAQLTAIADANLPFSTDEDGSGATGADPFVSTFDFTSDPQRYFNDRLDLVAKLRPTLLNGTVEIGDDYSRYLKAEEALMSSALTAGLYLSKYVGGFAVERFRRGAKGAGADGPVTPVSGPQQEAALAGVLRVLSDDKDLFPQPGAVPFMLGPSGECEGLFRYCLGRAPPQLLRRMDEGRIKVLQNLMDEARLERVRMAEWVLKSKGAVNPLSVSSLMARVSNAIWGAQLAASTRVGNSRNWSLQLAWVDMLLKLAARGQLGNLPWEIAAAAAGELGRIQASVEGVTLDPAGASYPLLKAVIVKLQTANFIKGA